MNKLKQVQLFLNFYFVPWGAAKGEVWEAVTNNMPFNDESAVICALHILNGKTGFTDSHIKLMKIVVPDS